MKSLLRTTLVMVLFCTMGIGDTINASSVLLPPTAVQPPEWRDMKLKELITLSTKEISRLSGKKITLREKYIFFMMKGKMKHELKKHPEITFGEFMVPIKQTDKVAWILLGVVILGLAGVFIILNQLPH